MPLPGAWWGHRWFCRVPDVLPFLASAAAPWHWGEAAANWGRTCLTLAAAVLGVGNTLLLSPLFLRAGRGGQIAFTNNFSNGKIKPDFPLWTVHFYQYWQLQQFCFSKRLEDWCVWNLCVDSTAEVVTKGTRWSMNTNAIPIWDSSLKLLFSLSKN